MTGPAAALTRPQCRCRRSRLDGRGAGPGSVRGLLSARARRRPRSRAGRWPSPAPAVSRACWTGRSAALAAGAIRPSVRATQTRRACVLTITGMCFHRWSPLAGRLCCRADARLGGEWTDGSCLVSRWHWRRTRRTARPLRGCMFCGAVPPKSRR